jgi:hypothetical protein
MFTSKIAAEKAYENYLISWTCHLFEQISYNGKET